MSDTMETSPLPEWVKKITSNLFGNKQSLLLHNKKPPVNEIQPKESDNGLKAVDVGGLLETVERHLTSDFAMTLSFSGDEAQNKGLIRYIIIDGEKSRVSLFITTKINLNPEADKILLGASGLVDTIGIKIFDLNTSTMSVIEWSEGLDFISRATRSSFDEHEFKFPVTGDWSVGSTPVLTEHLNILEETTENGSINFECMQGEAKKMAEQGGRIITNETSAQNLSILNLIHEMKRKVNPVLETKAHD